MQSIMDTIMHYNGIVNSFVWGAPVLILLVGTGVYLTLLLGLPQFRYFFASLSEVFSFKKKSGADKSISSFAAMATAMAATVVGRSRRNDLDVNLGSLRNVYKIR